MKRVIHYNDLPTLNHCGHGFSFINKRYERVTMLIFHDNLGLFCGHALVPAESVKYFSCF